MPFQTITISSVGTSVAAALNWRGGKPATVVVVSSAATSSATYTVQYTLDDLQLTASPTWFGVSSNTYAVDTNGATVFGASQSFPDGTYIPFPGPIGAVRMNVSSNSGSVTLTMKVMQGEGW